MTDKIQVSLVKTAGDFMIGCIRLNKPKALNALDLEMVNAMQSQLDAWRNDNDIGAVFIDSEGEKSFCAGGDIVSMYRAMASEQAMNSHKPPDFMAQFFEKEYRLDYTIHTFPKPIICWGNGIIMGGGLGIFAGASHKIVTETVRVAMPEITIGLFPDVGASYFLNKMPKGVGKFLGLTASSINAADCVNVGLADYFLLNENKPALLSALSCLSELSNQNLNASITQVYNEYAANTVWLTLSGNLIPIIAELEALAPLSNVSEIKAFMQKLIDKHPENKMLTKAFLNLQNGSPISARLVIEQLNRGALLSLAECFQMELSMAFQCSVTGEFQEGVRALLIDKDNQPSWLYKEDADIPDDIIQAHFSRFNSKHSKNKNEPVLKNPLESLVDEYGK